MKTGESNAARKLAKIIAGYVSFFAFLLVGAWAIDGDALMEIGTPSPTLLGQLHRLDADLASRSTREPPSTRIVVMGDSSQGAVLPPAQRTLASMRNRLSALGPAGVEVDGIIHPGFLALDFYFLLNRISGEAPDLVIIPVNLRSFGPYWLSNPRWQFPRLQGYVRTAEIPTAIGLSSQERPVLWSHLLLHKLDRILFRGAVAPLLEGLKLRYRELERPILAGIGGLAGDRFPEMPALASGSAEASHWAPTIEVDHPLFPVFRAINGLAARHDIQILYYPVQVNEARNGLSRRDVDARYAFIRRQIADAPGVHWFERPDRVPDEDFLDQWEHYDGDNTRAVAEDILAEALRILDSKRAGPG